MKKPIKNPETEALAIRLARQALTEGRDAATQAFRDWKAEAKSPFWVTIAIADRVVFLVENPVLLAEAEQSATMQTVAPLIPKENTMTTAFRSYNPAHFIQAAKLDAEVFGTQLQKSLSDLLENPDACTAMVKRCEEVGAAQARGEFLMAVVMHEFKMVSPDYLQLSTVKNLMGDDLSKRRAQASVKKFSSLLTR